MIEDGRNGLLVPFFEPQRLAERLYDAITRLQYGEDADTRGWQTIV